MNLTEETTTLLEETEAAVADDLTKIEGISPEVADALNDAGIETYADLAETPEDELEEVLAAAGGSVAFRDPSNWSEQAALAAQGETEKLEAWQEELKNGNVSATADGGEEE